MHSLPQEFVVSPKTMLVLLDQSEDSTARLDVACALAKAHGAHLTALAMVQQIAPYVPAGLDAGASVIDVGQIEETRQQAQDLASAADRQMAAPERLPKCSQTALPYVPRQRLRQRPIHCSSWRGARTQAWSTTTSSSRPTATWILSNR